jgi:hypothetical protein
VDKNGFYMTINSGEDCIVIPKADLIAPGGPELANMVVFHNLALEALPATDFSSAKAPDAPEVLLNKEFGDDCGKLFLYKVTWKGKTPSISDQQVIPLSKNFIRTSRFWVSFSREATNACSHPFHTLLGVI